MRLPHGLGATRISGSSVRPAQQIPRSGIIRVTPVVPGLKIDVCERTLSLWQKYQWVEFLFRPLHSTVGKVCRGRVQFWLDTILLSETKVVIYVVEEDARGRINRALQQYCARPYRRVFPSYSHSDSQVVDHFAEYVDAFGDEYLQDVRKLRTGQQWKVELLDFITQADLFQLFWSQRAAESPYVRREWQFALKESARRSDPYFIRPVFWSEEPFGPIPPGLKGIHFTRIPEPTRTIRMR
jgi:hypothetical protein